ncbi:capsule assembly Wzi family protein [Geobacter argillaceus]|uniref:Capsule assembly protein Wzi n=1 Tax=Geobacter argillaceus TaxID=345631 RepID=A0A562W9J9_9BACT|nr:capsule assembly Wzi family protein [Geobacter argillaceus]TWJ26364.1 capsule assembly protein Wzi [Geobacter argillaceus]
MIRFVTLALILLFCLVFHDEAHALSSANVALDSPIYLYLEKLAGMGLVHSDIWGVRPFSKAEAARLVLEAEQSLADGARVSPPMARQLVARLKELLPREIMLRTTGDRPPLFDVNPFVSARLRYVHLDGASRSYERPVHDPGNDGVFGIGSGLRPVNAYPSPTQQHGVEGTPLLEGNEGVRYGRGHNGQFQFTAEASVSDFGTVLIEPLLLYQAGHGETVRLNKGYLKLGGGGLELEAGRDAGWLGPGNRTAITLSNNPKNLDQVKLWSPEPIRLRYIGAVKYALILSRLDHTGAGDAERQPWFYAVKLAVKPMETLEIGLNLGRQQGGPGVNNSIGDNIRGLLGGTSADNSNSVAGIDLRLRLPWLRNTILYGEFSGEDTAAFWPIVESYVAGVYVPNLTSDGRNELRFEYYQGNSILSTNGTFPEGYLYKGMNLGPSQGGAAQQLFWRYTHYLSPRMSLSLDYFHTERGNRGRVPVNSQGAFDANGVMQAVERANAGRFSMNLPIVGDIDLNLMYGAERINNVSLVAGVNRTNQLLKVDISYRY